MNDTELILHATEFRFETVQTPDQYLYVRVRDGAGGKMLFCVMHNSEVLNDKGKWEYEPTPSSRTKSFIKRTRFLREKAIKLALQECLKK